MGSSKSKTICESAPRPAMPMTSLTCTSRQARTQSVQWMQASRLTAMAGWLASAAGARRARQPPGFQPGSGNPAAEARGGVVGLGRLVGQQQLQHQARGRARRPVARAVHGHARLGAPEAGRGQRAFPLDLDHAGAALAVGAVARLRRIAEMRQHRAEARRSLPDRLAGAAPCTSRPSRVNGTGRAAVSDLSAMGGACTPAGRPPHIRALLRREKRPLAPPRLGVRGDEGERRQPGQVMFCREVSCFVMFRSLPRLSGPGLHGCHAIPCLPVFYHAFPPIAPAAPASKDKFPICGDGPGTFPIACGLAVCLEHG